MATKRNRQQADTEADQTKTATNSGDVGTGTTRAPADTPEKAAAHEGAAEGTNYTDDAAAATAAGDVQTTDYTRRAGGYVLTDKGWVLDTADAEASKPAEVPSPVLGEPPAESTGDEK